MTPEEARELIGLETSFSPEELETAFRCRCEELESKIERAPTPGLKEKYGRSLSQLEDAWEVLSGNDSAGSDANFPSLIPVGGSARVDAGNGPPPQATKSSNERRETSSVPKRHPPYVVVGAIVVFIFTLGGIGCYFGVLVPAEKSRRAEIARQEAIHKEVEAQAAADAAEQARLAEEARKAAAVPAEFLGVWHAFATETIPGVGPSHCEGYVTISVDGEGNLTASGHINKLWNNSSDVADITGAQWSDKKLLLTGTFTKTFYSSFDQSIFKRGSMKVAELSQQPDGYYFIYSAIDTISFGVPVKKD